MGMIKSKKRRKNREKIRKLQNFISILEKNTPFSYIEAFKTLRTNIDFISSTNGISSILVTSAVPDESKSTTAINLAISLVENRHSVVLVECDLRMPMLRKYLKLDKGTRGLSSVLAGKCSLEDSILDVKELGISVIHAGAIPPNPSELLNQNRMKQVIENLENRFDFVILDGPPVTVVTDAIVVGRMTDGALLVVRSRFAPTKTVRLAKQKLESVNIKVLGAVLTRFNCKKWGWRSGYSYQGYENNYDQILKK